MAAAPQMLSESILQESMHSPLLVLPPTASSIQDFEENGSQWQHDLQRSIRTVDELCQRLGIPEHVAELSATEHFPLLVPESFIRRMIPGDPQDPLLRQVLPVAAELLNATGFTSDPVGDLDARQAPGLLQKYHGRALLILNGLCAIHCRYCFRRDYPYANEPKSLEDWEPTFAAIEADASISEVILSGGDPLMISDQRLARFLARLADIPHLQRVRIHSRLPIVLPSRITEELLAVLGATRLQPIFVVHANHPAELVKDCSTALKQLVQSGIPTLNQAVLLRGVNDRIETLSALCERCINLGVIPYYLHQLDRVAGGIHFEVPVEEGLELINALRQRLPGYAVPRYVQEIAGETSKTLILDDRSLSQ